jgi:hypothetical protein
MGYRSIENLTAIDRVYNEENPIEYLLGDVIKFTLHNGGIVKKTVIEENVMVDYPTEEEINIATLAIEAKRWRNQELKNTDTLSLLADHPNNTNILSYRQELRDWPNTNKFPLTKPILN